MPFRSKKQVTWMRINRPDLYREWKAKYGLKIVKSSGKKRNYGKRGKKARSQ
jgi:hypothetical protein